MSQFKKLLAVSVIAVLPVINSAHALSSLISLPGGVAAPLSEQTISLDKLRDGVTYNVRCTLESDNKSNQEVNYIQVMSSGNFGINANFAVNDQPLNAGGIAQASISAKNSNTFDTYSVNATFRSITVRNLDDTDSVIIKNCYALPSV